MAAKPIEPLPNELFKGDPRATHPQYEHHSPQRLDVLAHNQPSFDDARSRSPSPVVGAEGVEDALCEKEFRSFLQGDNDEANDREDQS